MCTAISYNHHEFIEEFIERFRLDEKLMTHRDSTVPEVVFRYQDKKPLLPVRAPDTPHAAGTLQIIEWGNRDNKKSHLPHTGWCRVESLEAGKWDWLHPREVIIPASHGLEKGVWFKIDTGMKGVIVHDEAEQEHVYMLTKDAEDTYRALTKHDRMPVFIA